MDPAHAAAMLAQMQSGLNPAVKMERSAAPVLPGMNPMAAAAAAAACMPQPWGSPFGWHPSLWAGNPYMNPLLNPAAAAAAAAAQMNAVVSSASIPAMVPSLEQQRTKSELPKKQRLSTEPEPIGTHRARAIEVVADKKSTCGPHSGTQRRPLREEFEDDAEYCQAYHRWRQVRDRNNDAVKRSREKYKSKRKSAEPATSRERELEQKLGGMQCQLVLLARALTGSNTLSPLEQAEVQLVLKATLASIEPSTATPSGTQTDSSQTERTSPIVSDARVPANDSDSALHAVSPQSHDQTGPAGSSSPSSACSSHESDGDMA